jgi:hypothetical protein
MNENRNSENDPSFLKRFTVRKAMAGDGGLLTPLLYFSIMQFEPHCPDLIPCFSNADAIWSKILIPAIKSGDPVLVLELDGNPVGMLAWASERSPGIEFRWSMAREVVVIASFPIHCIALRAAAAKIAREECGIEKVILQTWRPNTGHGTRGDVHMLDTNETSFEFFDFPTGGSILSAVG